ncbi:hypothetical protein NPIL_396981 [Nephila pilipes]|uniref:Uncharacterized protein n=1 Tax=Nephila pilipes TaxID=299642 RepID=A0A8X6U6T0_NEPPI|nr:hypothetical protein NPIL_396981 [Nephila pilipes]
MASSAKDYLSVEDAVEGSLFDLLQYPFQNTEEQKKKFEDRLISWGISFSKKKHLSSNFVVPPSAKKIRTDEAECQNRFSLLTIQENPTAKDTGALLTTPTASSPRSFPHPNVTVSSHRSFNQTAEAPQPRRNTQLHQPPSTSFITLKLNLRSSRILSNKNSPPS